MKKVMRKSIVALVVVAMLISTLGNLSFPASAASGLLVQNGGFDDDLFMYTGTAVKMEAVTDTGNSNNTVLHAAGGGYVQQEVAVEANTDYIWSFRMKSLDGGVGNIYADVVQSDNTIITGSVSRIGGTYSNMYNGRAAINTNDSWATFKISFNSGSNTSVALRVDTYTANRDRYFDDWCLYEALAQGELVNGDFENGMAGYVLLNNGYNKDTVSVGYDSSRGSNIINLSTGSGTYSLNGFVLYQNVAVKANTNYVWSLMLGTSVERQHYLGVVAGDAVSTTGNTTIAATATTMTGAVSFEPNTLGGGAVNNTSGAIDPNWLMFGPNTGWKSVKIEFNSGNNTSICLAYVVRAYNRTMAFDDWALYEKPAVGEVVNGDFEDGLKGIYKDAWISTKVIADPDNAANHILQVGEPTNGTYYNEVSVEANTNYIWTFRAKSAVSGENTIIYVRPSGDNNTNLITGISRVGSAYANYDGTNAYVSTYGDWATFSVAFNSGNNNAVRLAHNTVVAGRKVYLDDWSLEKAPQPGELRNGGFENGLKYFVVADKATAEVTTEDVYDGTSALSVGGKEGAAAYTPIVYQEVLVEKNTDYAWRFCYKKTAGASSVVAVTAADGVTLLPSFLKTNSWIGSGRDSYTTSRQGYDKWHESLLATNWTEYTVIFNSGDETSVRLSINLITSARSGVTDNWSLEKYTFMMGDSDNDGTVDAKDLVSTKTILLTDTLVYYKSGADMDNNGKIDIIDLVKLKKAVACCPFEGYSLVWADDFGSEYLDSTKWTRGEHMSDKKDLEVDYTDKSLTVEDGSVTLYAGRNEEGSEKEYYTNAALTTCNSDGSAHLMSFKYGYVEMRAKIPFGAPAFPSFWMKSLPVDGVHGEIDIFEHFCYEGDRWIQSGIHKWNKNDSTHLLLKNVNGVNAIGGIEVSDGEWHTYALLWTPEKLDFICDGVTYHTIDITGYGTFSKEMQVTKEELGTVEEDCEIFHDYYYLIMNNYMHTPLGTDGADYAVNSSTELPLEYEIDYVRLFQNGDGSIRLGNL